MNGSSSKMTKNISTYKNVATKVHCKLILIRKLLYLKYKKNSEHDIMDSYAAWAAKVYNS